MRAAVASARSERLCAEWRACRAGAASAVALIAGRIRHVITSNMAIGQPDVR
jgi:hypothetical protein